MKDNTYNIKISQTMSMLAHVYTELGTQIIQYCKPNNIFHNDRCHIIILPLKLQ